MSFRRYIQKLERDGKLIKITAPISKTHEIAALMKHLEPQPVLFENVLESDFRVAGNICCTKGDFADYFGISVSEIIPTLTRAIESPTPPTPSHRTLTGVLREGEEGAGAGGEIAPCQEVICPEPDLTKLPILRHFAGDGGDYITSGVFIAKHPVHGQNMDFHRGMILSPTEMAVRVVRGRHFDAFLQVLGQVDVAICIGNPPNVLAAAATSVDIGVDELSIANALEPLQVVRAHSVDLLIPAQAEFVIEGTVYRDRRHAEGPFVDLTETQDVIRSEPVFVVKAITHRKDAIWQALLPGALEHKLLMGMPREPTIFRKVNEVVRCLDVNINPGGSSWLHAIVQIDKQSADDGAKAIHAAFAGHRSCKHVFVVDSDIDIYNPLEVEWAMATRFQGDRDMIVLAREPGSSLDPSAEPGTKLTTKIGFDLTAPVGKARRGYEKVPYPNVDNKRFVQA
ncbi:MAG: UbiD family decarboxylase [Chloroflexi bacterium]|nr:UbiD family decarboxylase [Chloroflexota bacterium]MBU1661991.1 UbiD family decarboxylase [Chloroflexota bacterium]